MITAGPGMGMPAQYQQPYVPGMAANYAPNMPYPGYSM